MRDKKIVYFTNLWIIKYSQFHAFIIMIIIIKYAIFFTAGALFFWPTELRLLKKKYC